tara:strand:+ start:256 stop:1224 length:969 start_codon:yes stop_codon:yes gene_type:complete
MKGENKMRLGRGDLGCSEPVRRTYNPPIAAAAPTAPLTTVAPSNLQSLERKLSFLKQYKQEIKKQIKADLKDIALKQESIKIKENIKNVKNEIQEILREKIKMEQEKAEKIRQETDVITARINQLLNETETSVALAAVLPTAPPTAPPIAPRAAVMQGDTLGGICDFLISNDIVSCIEAFHLDDDKAEYLHMISIAADGICIFFDKCYVRQVYVPLNAGLNDFNQLGDIIVQCAGRDFFQGALNNSKAMQAIIVRDGEEAVRDMENLIRLNFSAQQWFNNDSIEQICGVFTNIKEINISDTAVDEDGLAILRLAMPNCRIIS